MRPFEAELTWLKRAGIALTIAVGTVAGCGEERDPATGPNAADAPAAVAATVGTEEIDTALAATESYLASGQITEAEAIIAVLVRKAPDHARAREMYGRVLLSRAIASAQAGDSEAASDHFKAAYDQYDAATALESDSAGLHQSAGEIAHSVGLMDEALRHYRLAGQLDPLDMRPPLYEAQVLIAQGGLDDAEAALNRVLALDPDEPVAHGSLAMVALGREDYASALEHIAQARRISPHDLRFRAQEAKIHRRRGEPREALQLLVGLSAAERVDAAVTFEIGTSYGLVGEHERAAEAWEHRLKSVPEAPDAAVTAARAGAERLKAGQREQAWFWLERARLLAPDAPEVVALERALGEGGGGGD
ncbi:MAG: tetratricopeptide repeat protein [Phycisphaerales bacterium]|nr:MAG: tetratricopeptide repeat protein [Phycisphaerales bacterium]